MRLPPCRPFRGPRWDRLIRTTTCLASLSLGLAPSPACALPSGGTVSGGSATISTGPQQTTITQQSGRAVIDWQSYDVGRGETVQYLQPNASSITLNRIHDSKPSEVFGSIKANGQVWLVNANGFVFGQGSQIDVGGLVATSADIRDADFMAGRDRFGIPGSPDARIVNEGAITAHDAGLVALVAPSVVNNGVIEARLGRVELASGDSFALDLYGDGLVSLKVSDAVSSQLVSNSGRILADGGTVRLSAAAAGKVVNSVINMDGGDRGQQRGRAERGDRALCRGQQRGHRQ